MGKTIIQTIGPLYGEVVNGTVFGRPNGSIYVPLANTISLAIGASRQYVRLSGVDVVLCNSAGAIDWNNLSEKWHAIAESQDNANYIMIELAEDSAFTSIIGDRQKPAGQFNVYDTYVALNPGYTIVNATTYYARARLMSGSGVPVATSSTIAVEGWAE